MNTKNVYSKYIRSILYFGMAIFNIVVYVGEYKTLYLLGNSSYNLYVSIFFMLVFIMNLLMLRSMNK